MVPMFDLHYSSRRLCRKEAVAGEGRDLDWATPKHLVVDKSLRLYMETQRIQSWGDLICGGLRLTNLFRDWSLNA